MMDGTRVPCPMHFLSVYVSKRILPFETSLLMILCRICSKSELHGSSSRDRVGISCQPTYIVIADGSVDPGFGSGMCHNSLRWVLPWTDDYD
jgi:hypothetical protein